MRVHRKFDPLKSLAGHAKRRHMDMQCDPQWVLDLIAERDALRAEVERLRNPSDDMLVAGQEVWARGRIGALEDCEEARAIYMAMIDAAMEATR